MFSLSNLHALKDEELFASWKDARQALNDWAVSAKFTHRTAKKEPSRATYVCAVAGCPWHINGHKTKDGLICLRVAERLHNCESSGVAKRGAASKADWLKEAVSSVLLVTASTKPQNIVNAIQLHYSEKINYQAAFRTRTRLISGGLGKYRHSFQLLPAYFRRVKESTPMASLDLQINIITNKSIWFLELY